MAGSRGREILRQTNRTNRRRYPRVRYVLSDLRGLGVLRAKLLLRRRLHRPDTCAPPLTAAAITRGPARENRLTVFLTCVLVLFVSARPLTVDPPNNRDPNQDQAPADSPARTTRLRRVLRKLIAHGKQLAEDLTRRPSATTVFWTAVRFGTKDVALILARITRGLQLAAALHATLPKDRQPQRRARPARSAPDMRKPRTRPTPPQRNDLNSVLATLPTPKEIAAQLRHRPVGDVLAEICIELGILTADDFWQELEIALVENGADRDRIVEDADERITLSEAAFFPPETRLSPPLPATAPAATRPP